MMQPHSGDDKSSPLEKILVEIIRNHGPIRISDYMTDALCHPQYGYYTTNQAFGTQGDFITAPEISQIFGELIGAWLINAWLEIGSPSLFNFIELGPGRGTLMRDILRTAQLRPDFLKAARVYMVENSGRQRYEQQQKLSSQEAAITWTSSLEEVPFAPTLIIANEFLDCLPIRQFVRTSLKEKHCWRERMVGISNEQAGPRLAFHLSEELFEHPKHAPTSAKPEDVFETCEARDELLHEISNRFTEFKGRALFIDYGHEQSTCGDTLQAIKSHKYWPVLSAAGTADITAHVDFGATQKQAEELALNVDGPITQGYFLQQLGLEQRLLMLRKSANDTEKETLLAGARRLIDPNDMGKIFKVISLSSPSLPEAVGFA